MEILDISYEENSYVVENPTLNFNPELESEMKWEVINYPSYVAVKNKSNMCAPPSINSVTPFDFSTPNTQDLFGIHIFNKKFCFNDIKIISPFSSYPYLGGDSDKIGQLFDYNGVVTGYVLNGVAHEDVKVNLDDKNINFVTVNKDDITNSQTKRLLYTETIDNTMYGEYEQSDCELYYKIPYKKKTGTVMVSDYRYDKCEDCVFYRRIENEVDKYIAVNPNTIHGNDLYVKVKEYDINDEVIRSLYYQQIDAESYDFDTDKLRLFIKEDTYTEVECSDYQYIEITQNDELLLLNDGFGDGDEILLNNGDIKLGFNEMLLSTVETNDETVTVLKLKKEDVENYNLKIFKSFSGYKVYCTEDYIKSVETQKDVNNSSSNVNKVLINTQYNNYEFKTVVNKNVYYYGENINEEIVDEINSVGENIDGENINQIIFEIYNYKISSHTFNLLKPIENNDVYKSNINISVHYTNIDNTNVDIDYEYNIDSNVNKENIFNKILLTMAGISIDNIGNIDKNVITPNLVGNKKQDSAVKFGDNYEITVRSYEDDYEIFIVKRTDSNKTNIVKKYFFDVDEKTIKKIERTEPTLKYLNIKNIKTNNEDSNNNDDVDTEGYSGVFLTLKCGGVVNVGFIEDGYIMLDTDEQTYMKDGIELKYSVISEDNSNTIVYNDMTNTLLYPQYNETTIFNILEDKTWDNEICRDDSPDRYLLGDYYHFNVKYSNNDTHDSIFIVYMKEVDGIKYYGYTPQLSLEICEGFYKAGDLVLINNNEYLSNYPFLIDIYTVNNGIETFFTTMNVDLFDSMINIGNIEGDFEKLLCKITDYSGLTQYCYFNNDTIIDEGGIYVDVSDNSNRKIVFKSNLDNYNKMEIVLKTTDENNNNKTLVDLTEEDKTNGYILMNSANAVVGGYSDIKNIKEISLKNDEKIIFGPKSVSEIKHQIVKLNNNNLGIIIYTNDENFNYSYIEGNSFHVSIKYTTFCEGSNKRYPLVNKRLEFKNLQNLEKLGISNKTGYLLDLGIKYDKYKDLESDKGFWCNGTYNTSDYRVTKIWLEIKNLDLSGCIYKYYIRG